MSPANDTLVSELLAALWVARRAILEANADTTGRWYLYPSSDTWQAIEGAIKRATDPQDGWCPICGSANVVIEGNVEFCGSCGR